MIIGQGYNGKTNIRVNFSKLGNIQNKRSHFLQRIFQGFITLKSRCKAFDAYQNPTLSLNLFCPIPQLYFARIFDEERPFDILLIITINIIIIFSQINKRNT